MFSLGLCWWILLTPKLFRCYRNPKNRKSLYSLFLSVRFGSIGLQTPIAKTFLKKSGIILIVGDATTVTKSGKETFGLGRFFSSIYSRAVPGIAFQTLSLLDVEKRISWPMLIEQMFPKPKQEKPAATKNKKQKRGRGRPKVQKTRTTAMLYSMRKWRRYRPCCKNF